MGELSAFAVKSAQFFSIHRSVEFEQNLAPRRCHPHLEASCLMQLFVLGLNHQTAPLAVREQVAFPAESQPDTVRQLLKLPGMREVAVLSTCNRTEIYAVADEPGTVVAWLADERHLDQQTLLSHMYLHVQSDAARHAFRVASGLDSMVLGETQILGQMKDAVDAAEAGGGLGMLLHGLFQRTFSAAKAVRTHTDIGAHSVSIAAASVRQTLRIFPAMRELHVLFVGAGEMIELCAAHYHGQAAASLTVANRSRERGEALSSRHGASYLPLSALTSELARFDVIVTSTASSLPIVGKGTVERALKQRRHRPMVIFDLAVPRDVEPEAGALDDVFLYTIDDLSGIVQEGFERRAAAVGAAQHIVDEQVQEFGRWLEARHLVPLIRGLREQVDELRQLELEKALRQLARGEDAAQVLTQFSQQLSNKFLHHPMQLLNSAAPGERQALAELLGRLYNLDLPSE